MSTALTVANLNFARDEATVRNNASYSGWQHNIIAFRFPDNMRAETSVWVRAEVWGVRRSASISVQACNGMSGSNPSWETLYSRSISNGAFQTSRRNSSGTYNFSSMSTQRGLVRIIGSTSHSNWNGTACTLYVRFSSVFGAHICRKSKAFRWTPAGGQTILNSEFPQTNKHWAWTARTDTQSGFVYLPPWNGWNTQ